MKLENLIDFEWYNEPENVIFLDQEMKILAYPKTDFWQSQQHKIKKDNGHLFFKRVDGNFVLRVKWRFDRTDLFKQCGLMVRLDERNWFKASLLCQTNDNPEIGTCLTVSGHSDWAGCVLQKKPTSISYKIERRDNDFVCFYSTDEQKYIRLRQFYLPCVDQIKVGAYIASPQNENFEAVLDEVELQIF